MDILKMYKDKQLDKIISNTNNLTSINDLTAGVDPTLLFYVLADKLGYLLDSDENKVVTKEGIELRKKINPLIKKLGRYFLMNKQVFENRNDLLDNNYKNDINLPNEPVIWASNHSFKDDTLATILAIKRHAYIVFGSLPQFYNTSDGLTAWLNGVVMVNRKSKESKKTSIPKALKVLENGTDLMMFPEGVWNKTPEKLMINLWPGIYRICKEKGTKVVPVVHYLKDCSSKDTNNLIHTVVDEPVKIDDLSEKAALNYLRDIMSTWYYLMMEKYGKSTREEELKNFNNSTEAWETSLIDRVKTAARYDLEIELSADYKNFNSDMIDIWTSIANIDNINSYNVNDINYAKKMIKEYNKNNFQRKF